MSSPFGAAVRERRLHVRDVAAAHDERRALVDHRVVDRRAPPRNAASSGVMTSPRTRARSSSSPGVVDSRHRYPLSSWTTPRDGSTTRVRRLQGLAARPARHGLAEVAREAAERAVLGEQLALGAALDDLAVLDDEDLVGAADGREAVRDDDRRAAVQQPVERLLDQDLGRPVDVRRRLVEDEDARIGEQRARDRDQLPLARREARRRPRARRGRARRRSARRRGRCRSPRRSRAPARRSRRAARSGCCRRSCRRRGTDPGARRRACRRYERSSISRRSTPSTRIAPPSGS